MKKIMFITLTILFALSASSCRDKKEQNRTEQQIENAKENVNDALDKASNKIEDGADKLGSHTDFTANNCILLWKVAK